MEGGLGNTNYVVIIVTAPGQETQSCVVVTGGCCNSICICISSGVVLSG